MRDRQKQHFAKVQSNLRNGSKNPSPLKFSFLGTTIESNTGIRHPSTSRTLSCSRPISRHQDGPIGPQASLHGDSRLSCTPHKPRLRGQTDRESIQRRLQSVPDDDLYSATLLPSEKKRKHDLPINLAVNESVKCQEDESEFDKRRRILRKADWVGVGVQRPLQVAFAAPNNVELVGRRRKVMDGHQARYNHNMQSFSKNPFTGPNRTYSPRNHGERRRQTAHWGTSDVRISIGGQVIPPGISSSSIPSRRRETSVRSGAFDPSQGSSSDVMLLDNEDYAGKRIRANEEVYYSGRGKHVANGNRSHYNKGQQDLSGGNPETNMKYDEYGCQSTSGSASHIGDYGGIFHSVGKDSNGRGQPIVSSSTTSLQHPKPQSSRTSLLLRSDSAEITASIVAQVGTTNPIVPSSQAIDNEIWESWVGPVFDEHSQQELEDLREQRARIQGVSISPGISQGPMSRHANGWVHSEYGGEHPSSESGWEHSSRYYGLSQDSNQSLPPCSGEIYGEGVKKMSPLEPPVGTQQEFHPKQIGAIDHHVKTQEGPDLENIWKKFVFGSSDGEVEAMGNQGRKHPTALCPPKRHSSPASSMLAVLSAWDSI